MYNLINLIGLGKENCTHIQQYSDVESTTWHQNRIEQISTASASRYFSKFNLELWPNRLENVVSLSPKYSKYSCKFWFTSRRRFTSYRDNNIFVYPPVRDLDLWSM